MPTFLVALVAAGLFLLASGVAAKARRNRAREQDKAEWSRLETQAKARAEAAVPKLRPAKVAAQTA